MVSRGPLLGTVMWPLVERSCCLFAEGGKTTLRTIDSASPCAPGSAASVWPDCPAQIMQGGGSGTSKGAALSPASKDGCHLSPRGR